MLKVVTISKSVTPLQNQLISDKQVPNIKSVDMATLNLHN